MVQKHPNMVVALVTGMFTSGVLWVAGRAGWDLSQTEAGAVATAAVSVVLFIGKVGFRGVWSRILNGSVC